ncbi:MAG: hypothetical protein ABH824_05575 [Nanoarchaeota archaeon]|nr:hypothetical protein [Nanoarchaeota archaeon]MBU1632318.1 hypothetical protein [Nanoarchaeota archaeon]MBU1875877.1 hypothetical protein [Nanoarchaeota archaeon]
MSNMVLKYIFCLILILILITGCTKEPEVQLKVTGTEEIGGKHNLTLIKTEVTIGNKSSTMKKIQYVKDNKVIDPDQTLPDEMRPALDWLKENTPTDAVIMSWWDYGHAIRAYSEREPVIDAPSKEILTTTVAKYLGKSSEEVNCDSCTAHEVIQDVARLFLSESSNEAIVIMKKYSANYLYVNVDEKEKSIAFYTALGKEKEEISNTILNKALQRDLIEKFKLVYSDDTTRIYELKS